MQGSAPSCRNTAKFESVTAPNSPDNVCKIPDPEPSFFANRVYQAMLSDKAQYYADITLITSDGKRIPVASMHLSISSPYFEKLLISELVERNRSEIWIDIPSVFLYQLLDFIYTDDCRPIQSVRKCVNGSTIIPCTLIRDIIILGCVAQNACMERLLARCEKALTLSMKLYPYLASFILQAFNQDKSEWGQSMWYAAMVKIATSMGSALLGKHEGCEFKCGLIHLDETTAEEVFFELVKRRTSGHVTHHIIFEALVIWASGGKALPEDCEEEMWWEHYSIEVGKGNMIDMRLPTAKKIATWFDITRFEARFLSDVVEPSGLVDPALVTEAYKNLSLQYEKSRTDLDGQRQFYYDK